MNYTIITPHKNTPELLERLLKSIPVSIDAQIIVVDDHSDTDKYRMVEHSCQQHHVELYTSEGRYAGGARNTGLKHARGEWVVFADADDYFLPDFASQVNKYKDSDADIVFFPVISRYADTMEPSVRGDHLNLMIEKYHKTGQEGFLRCCHLSPCSKMIRLSLIQQYDIQYDLCMAGEDMWFAANAGLYAGKIEVSDTPIYCITASPGTLSTAVSKERFESIFQCSLRTNRFLRSQGKGRYQMSVLYYLGMSYQFGIRYMFHVIASCVRMRANPFIGLSKILNLSKTLENRHNKKKI